ncbi:MAG: ATP-binding protein [Acidobacteriota bacterium]
MPGVIERAIRFVDRNTRHPMRVVGLNRLRLDEYPIEPLREALVNAVAHRQYEDAGRKILLEVYADRAWWCQSRARSEAHHRRAAAQGQVQCSRNPVLAHALSYFHRIEECGSGFRRMRSGMLAHGLDAPLLGTDTGYFGVTFPGPGEDLERITIPESRLLVTPAVEAQLSERQKKMAAALASGEGLTSRRCQQEFGVTRETVSKDFAVLVDLGLAVKQGQGRSTRYISSREAEP